jgi:hypothetical protein
MRILAALILVVLATTSVHADTFRFMWDAPVVDADHPAAVSYVVQTSQDALNWATVDTVASEEFNVDLQPGEYLYLRVAGISEAGFRGVWSAPSDLLSFSPPGQPGQPYWVEASTLAAPTPLIFRK